MTHKSLIDVNIDIKHLTRVEGHGNIIVNVNKGTIEKCIWQVPEAPRFFESLVRGRHYSEVARITSRICGICSIGHTLASVKATENALGIQVSEQTIKLRQLLKHAENFDSNILHIYLLVAPDLLGAKSVFPLLENQPEIVKRALKLKRIAHEWGNVIGGRTTHPTRVVPGGFSQIPDKSKLIKLKQSLQSILPDINATINLLLSLVDKIPVFSRPSEYIALSNKNNYALYDGIIQSRMLDDDQQNDQQKNIQRYAVNDYLSITNEYVSKWSTAKYCKNRIKSYMVGALSRLNNNYAQLTPQAQEVAEQFGFINLSTRPCTNPYMNTIAQVVELVNDIYVSVDLIDELLTQPLVQEPIIFPTQFGNGKAAVEVPRGILFHEYSYTDDGLCKGGNFVIPTNQNHANIQYDFEQLLPELLAQNKTENEIELALEMLVRAYDPCISCSAHYLKIKFESKI